MNNDVSITSTVFCFTNGLMSYSFCYLHILIFIFEILETLNILLHKTIVNLKEFYYKVKNVQVSMEKYRDYDKFNDLRSKV